MTRQPLFGRRASDEALHNMHNHAKEMGAAASLFHDVWPNHRYGQSRQT